MTCLTVQHGFGRPSTGVFLCRCSPIHPPQASVPGLRTGGFLCFGEPAEGFGFLYLYVSMYCFLTCLGYIILGARRGRLFLWTRGVWFFPWGGEAGGGFAFIGFFLFRARAAKGFLYLETNNAWLQKKKKRKKEKKNLGERIFTQPCKYFPILQDCNIITSSLFTYIPPLQEATNETWRLLW